LRQKDRAAGAVFAAAKSPVLNRLLPAISGQTVVWRQESCQPMFLFVTGLRRDMEDSVASLELQVGIDVIFVGDMRLTL